MVTRFVSILSVSLSLSSVFASLAGARTAGLIGTAVGRDARGERGVDSEYPTGPSVDDVRAAVDGAGVDGVGAGLVTRLPDWQGTDAASESTKTAAMKAYFIDKTPVPNKDFI